MTNSKLTDEHFNHLADVMLSMFGHKWRSQYGLDIDPLWRRCLADLDPEELQRGVTELGHQGAQWPPSLPEFRKLCRPPAEAPAPPCHRLLPRVAPETAEQKTARKVRGRAALDSIYKRMPHLRCGHRGPNPGKRVEDRTGIKAFCVNWLNRSQATIDRGFPKLQMDGLSLVEQARRQRALKRRGITNPDDPLLAYDLRDPDD